MTVDEVLASSRHVVTYGAGFMTAFGLTKVVDPNVLVTSFDHIFNGIKEISIGVGPLAAAGMGWWATRKSSPAAQVAAVKASDPAVLVEAVAQVSPSQIIAAASAMPEVKKIDTSSPMLAAAARAADPAPQVNLVPAHA